MIEIRNLSFHYGDGDFSLWLPQLTVDDGESVAFVGPSGSGKTTLLNLVSGVLRPTAGQIVTADYSISDLDERQRREFRLSRIGLVFQEFELLENLNGVELHWEPDAMPTDRMWHDLARLWEQHPANWMIWESAPLQEIVSRLEASGIRSVVFDPIGNAPEEGNYLTIMHHNINGLLDTAPTH